MASFDSQESVSDTLHKLTNEQLAMVNAVLREEMRNRGLLTRPDRPHGRPSGYRGGRGGPRNRGDRGERRGPPRDMNYGQQNR